MDILDKTNLMRTQHVGTPMSCTPNFCLVNESLSLTQRYRKGWFRNWIISQVFL